MYKVSISHKGIKCDHIKPDLCENAISTKTCQEILLKVMFVFQLSSVPSQVSFAAQQAAAKQHESSTVEILQCRKGEKKANKKLIPCAKLLPSAHQNDWGS